jgi:ribose 5-phosphate isomerase A
MSSAPSPEDLDRVAEQAFGHVRAGMRLGLGTGRAAEAFIRRLGRAVADGLEIVGVPTSHRSEKLARELGIPLGSLDSIEALDVAFDGADEVAPDLSLIKGLGGAMLRERVVASAAARFVVLVTEEKLVTRLGERAPLPIEVVGFALSTVRRALAKVGLETSVRQVDGRDFITDNGHPILDAGLHVGIEPRGLDARVRALPGVVDTGFFFDRASSVIVGAAGAVRVLDSTRA